MLHIILMILKILGILILSILGLGFCIGLLLLFCPVRYYLEGSIYGKPKGHIRVSWLLRLICVTFSYKENRFSYKLCILGIQLRRRKKKEGKKKQGIGEKESEKSIEIPEKIENKEEVKSRDKNDKNNKNIEESQLEIKNSCKETDKNEGREEPETKKTELIETGQAEVEKEEVSPVYIEEPVLELEAKKNWKQLLGRILSGIKSIPDKIKGILTKIKETFLSVKAGIQKFLVLLKDFNKKKQAVLTFIKDEKNKEAFRYTKGKLFQLLCHVLPRKVTLKLHYGFVDPAITGILTGMIFMFYPKSAEKFQLMPDFENRVLEGELTIKGRVRLVKVLWILLSVYFHKECNRIIKMIIKRK